MSVPGQDSVFRFQLRTDHIIQIHEPGYRLTYRSSCRGEQDHCSIIGTMFPDGLQDFGTDGLFDDVVENLLA